MTFTIWKFKISFELTPTVKDECINLILAGERIHAIKHYRDHTFPIPTLKEGKEYIDKLALTVGIDYEERYKQRLETFK